MFCFYEAISLLVRMLISRPIGSGTIFFPTNSLIYDNLICLMFDKENKFIGDGLEPGSFMELRKLVWTNKMKEKITKS